MNAPFTTAEFLEVFARYNEATATAPFLLTGLAASVVLGFVSGWKHRDRWTCGVLTLLWLWSGAVFHLGFFAGINPAAVVFGLLFLVQAGAFFWRGVVRHDVRFDCTTDPRRTFAGIIALAYAIVIYPFAALASGHHWPAMPTFGAPCPIDILTLGLLVWSAPVTPRLLLVVPVAWSLVASIGAWEFGMHEDWFLGLMGVVAVCFNARNMTLHDVVCLPDTAGRLFRRRRWKHGSKI
jgi:hypothetical protein